MRLSELKNGQIPISKNGLDKLKSLLNDWKAKDKELSETAGDTFGGAADWHDNAAKDQWVIEARVVDNRLSTLSNAISQVVIVEPQKEPGPIDLGHTVVLKYEDEPEPEKYTILGPFDNFANSTWISYQSDLARLLIGKEAGREVSLPSGLKVTILQVLAGQF